MKQTKAPTRTQADRNLAARKWQPGVLNKGSSTSYNLQKYKKVQRLLGPSAKTITNILSSTNAFEKLSKIYFR
jgi:hypothetical protein